MSVALICFTWMHNLLPKRVWFGGFKIGHQAPLSALHFAVEPTRKMAECVARVGDLLTEVWIKGLEGWGWGMGWWWNACFQRMRTWVWPSGTHVQGWASWYKLSITAMAGWEVETGAFLEAAGKQPGLFGDAPDQWRTAFQIKGERHLRSIRGL